MRDSAEEELLREVEAACANGDEERAARSLPGGWFPAAVGIVESKRHLRQRLESIVDDRGASAFSVFLSIAAIVLVAYTLCTSRPDAAIAAGAQSLPSDAKQGLESPKNYTFNARPLSKAIEEIAQVTGMASLIDSSAIKAAGISEDTPITGSFRSIRSAQVLTEILKQASIGKSPLEYIVEDGRLVVSTHEALAEKNTDTRVFDVRDLMVAIPDFTQVQNANIQGGGRNGPAPKAPAVAKDLERDAEMSKLIERIRGSVAPGTWGDTGSISPFGSNQQLIVTQTPLRHLQVAALLEELREKRSIQVSVEVRFIRCSAADAKIDPVLRTLPAGSHRVISDQEVNDFIRVIHRSQNASILTAPRLTLFNNQMAQLFVGQDISYVKEMAADENGLLKPKTGVVETGVRAKVHCKVTEDHQAVTTDAQLESVQLVEMPTVPAPNDQTFQVQSPITRVEREAMSSMIQSGKTYALACGPAKIVPFGAKPAEPIPDERLFILIKTTVIEQHESKKK